MSIAYLWLIVYMLALLLTIHFVREVYGQYRDCSFVCIDKGFMLSQDTSLLSDVALDYQQTVELTVNMSPVTS